MQECAIISEKNTDGESHTIQEIKVTLSESDLKSSDLRLRLEEAEEHLRATEAHVREMQAAHEVEKVELRDYYQNAMGQLDAKQKFESDQCMKDEEKKTMLQSSVRVVAGHLDDIKQVYICIPYASSV